MPSKPLKAIKPMFSSPSSWRIVRGDQVQVMVGKDKGKTGEVLRVVRDKRFPRVFVSGLNMMTRHVRKQPQDDGSEQPGFSVRMEAAIHYSNVMIVDPETSRPVRTYFVFEDQPPYRRVRKTRGKGASNCVVPWPEKWRDDFKPSFAVGDLDTAEVDVTEVTYNQEADFNIALPTAHRKLREVQQQMQQLRDAAAAQAAAQQRLRKQQRKASMSLGSGGSSSSSTIFSSGMQGVRGFATRSAGSSIASSLHSLCSSSSSNSQGSWPKLLQHSRLGCSDGLPSTRRSSVAGQLTSQRCSLLGWFGLAAAPAVARL